jgi:hypothetical protein
MCSLLLRLRFFESTLTTVLGIYSHEITEIVRASCMIIVSQQSVHKKQVAWLQVHPSRHGTYDGISMHPYEVVFLKASWHVGVPFADMYAVWQTKVLRGQPGTDGAFDDAMYHYAITYALLSSVVCALLFLHGHGMQLCRQEGCSEPTAGSLNSLALPAHTQTTRLYLPFFVSLCAIVKCPMRS